MAFGGGTFLVQNKVMPGAYINFVSLARASMTLKDRGVGALAIEMDWGPDSSIFTVEQADFQENCLKYFGYDYTADEMKGLRDLFMNLKTGYFYRLNGGGVKASCDFATAKYSGTRGNVIKIVVAANVDEASKFDVSTFFDGNLVDRQTAVSDVKGLVNNDYVTWITTATLAVTAGTTLTGGTDGTAATGTTHSAFLAALEAYSFNVLGCLSTDETIKGLYLAYTKRMRDDVGAKFQLVAYSLSKPDYEGCINLTTPVSDSAFTESAAVYWVMGAEASCQVNRSVTNKTYDGEFTLTCETKQSTLSAAITAGQFVFHKVNDEIRVLKDINSFVSFTTYKNRDFSLNQVIRVLDQIANDTASTFESTYLGKVQNNAAGRVAFWNDLVYYAKTMQTIEAITDFDSANITVKEGETKEAVYVEFTVKPVVCMEKLYMYVYVA